MAELPSGTVTFLFTDIEGSTALWEQDPAGMRAALARHDALLRHTIEAHGGHIFKTVGDEFCAAFETASDALAAALEGQRALVAEPWGEMGPLRVRMALHTGAAEERSGDYFGPSVNRVARLLACGYGGQILLSAAVHELIRDQIPSGVALSDLGEQRLKDLIRLEHVFQVVGPDLPGDFPPLTTLDRRPNNLPMQATPFIGREREVATVTQRLLRPDVRLLTLTGPGGTGKTRLGLQVAAALLEHFDDGIFLVRLDTISDPGLVGPAVAQTLRIRESGDRPLLESLKEHLRNKQLLLLLDNFEQVLGAAPLVTELLGAGPKLKILVTSRAVLHLYGEHTLVVPPLALPERGPLPPLEQLIQYEAVHLFSERAQAVKADFAVTEDNAPSVAEICRRLDGLPLAIELAAARVGLLAPQAMLARLERRLPLLTGGAQDLPVRQQALRRTIAWSYDLLDQEEQRLFRRLAVFVGGCTLEAAETVCNAAGDPSARSGQARGIDVLEGVTSLVDKSLLRQTEGSGEPRFEMLETLREYGLERLEASGEAETLRRRHAEHYVALAEQAESELIGPRQGGWLERMEWEYDNLRAALGGTLDRGEAELGLRLAGALGHFWEMRGHLSEGQHRLEQALSQGRQGTASVRAKALSAAGVLAFLRNLHDLAAARHEESLALRRQLGDQSGTAMSLHNLGRVSHYQRDYERAAALYEESLAVQRALGDRRGMAMTLNSMGVMARGRGDHAAARALSEESLALFRELGDRWGEALLLNNLARLARDSGDWRTTAALCEGSLRLFRELGDRHGIAWVLSNLVIVAQRRGAWERAARLFGAAEALREAISSSSLSLSPDERGAYEAAVSAVRTQLGEEAFVTAGAEGRAMSLERVVAYALEDPTPTRQDHPPTTYPMS